MPDDLILGNAPGILIVDDDRDFAESLADLLVAQGYETQIADRPLWRLVTTLLTRHADALKRLPATLNKFHPFHGGLLEHTLAVTHSCLWLVEKYAVHYPDSKPPLNRDLVVAGAILHDIGRVVELDQNYIRPQPTVLPSFQPIFRSLVLERH